MCVFLVALLLIPTTAIAAEIVWPDLSKVGHVKGRAATEKDVKNGNAAFVIKVDGVSAGKPIDIQIPQYALHIEEGTGKETPVVIIQAEENQDIQAVGYMIIGEGTVGVCLLKELRLLGSKKPK